MKPYLIFAASMAGLTLAACSPQTAHETAATADHAGDAAASAVNDTAANARTAADATVNAAGVADRKADAAADAAAKQQ